MNVYDFDGTIYNGDSSVDFYLFCIRLNPSLLFKCGFTQMTSAVKYAMKLISKEKFKESFFSFLRYISLDDRLLNEFWDNQSCHIREWYLLQKRPDDVIISASPDFLLKPMCERLGVTLIASMIDPKTGRFIGENCRGEEKKRRFSKLYPYATIDRFYTDSKSDMPLILIANKSYIIKGNKITAVNKTAER